MVLLAVLVVRPAARAGERELQSSVGLGARRFGSGESARWGPGVSLSGSYFWRDWVAFALQVDLSQVHGLEAGWEGGQTVQLQQRHSSLEVACHPLLVLRLPAEVAPLRLGEALAPHIAMGVGFVVVRRAHRMLLHGGRLVERLGDDVAVSPQAMLQLGMELRPHARLALGLRLEAAAALRGRLGPRFGLGCSLWVSTLNYL